MKKTILFLFLITLFGTVSGYAKKKENTNLSYEVKCAGVGKQGYYLVEVSALAPSKKEVDLDYVEKCAIHGVLFQGVAPSDKGAGQKPLVGAINEQDHADYFNAFFKNDYKRYASAADTALKTTKVKDGYQVTATILVAKDELRKAMEDAGVLSKLGF